MNFTASVIVTPQEATGLDAHRSGDPIRTAIHQTVRRLRGRRLIQGASIGLLIGSLSGFGLVIALNCSLLSEESLPGGGAFLILLSLSGLLLGCTWGMASKYDAISVARFLERRLDLKDRLSTALSVGNENNPIARAQRDDANDHAPDEAAIRSVLPYSSLPRHVYIAGAVTLAVLIGYFAPILPIFWSSTRRAEQAVVRKEGDRLLAIAKTAEKEAQKQHTPEAQQAARKIAALGRDMQRGRMPLRDALIKRAKLSDELEKAQQKIANGTKRVPGTTPPNLSQIGQDWQKSMRDAHATPNSTNNTGTADGRTTALQDALARGDRAAAARTLREMADAAARGEPKPGPERDKATQQLSSLGDALQKNGANEAGAQAKQAAGQMRSGDMNGASQTLRDAARRLEQGDPSPQNPGQQSDNNSNSSVHSPINQLRKMTASVRGQTRGESGNPNQSGSQSPASSANPSASGASPQQSSSSSQGASQGGSPSSAGQSPSESKASGSGKPGGNSASRSGERQHQTSGGHGSGASHGGNGIGSGTSGGPKGSGSTNRLNRSAIERNITGTHSTTPGKETVINEQDNDHSALPAASLPYYDEFVHGNGKGGPASEAAQQRENIPAPYRKQVRGYFDALPTGSHKN